MPDSNVLSFLAPEMKFLLPEVILTLGLLFVLVFTVLAPKKTAEENSMLMTISLVFVAAALGAMFWVVKPMLTASPQPMLSGTVTMDYFGYLVRTLLLFGAGITLAISHAFLEKNTRIIGDFYALVMGATLGGLFLAMATDLILVFVALETLSITSYILAGYLRRTARSAEASFKYLVYGGMGTAVFLFGLSLVYGLSGSTQFTEIASHLATVTATGHPTLTLLMILVFTAMAFKLSAAPFHMWAPDVYDGAPTPVAAFLSVVSKTAAFAMTLRALIILFPGFAHWQLFWVILAVLSMVIGNVVALKQTHVKRLLAYSTVAHAGYMLLALSVGYGVAGLGSLLFYLITYLFMNLGAFAVAIHFTTLTGTDEISAYSGLVQKRPGITFAFCICLLSLAGIPITSGFFAKFFLFQAVALSGPAFLWLVGLALLMSTVSLAYYINLIRLMVVKEPSSAVECLPDTNSSPTPFALSTALAFCVVATVLLGIFATPFFEFSKSSAQQLVQEAQPAPAVSQVPGGLQ